MAVGKLMVRAYELSGVIGFSEYDSVVQRTDKLPFNDLRPVVAGLFAEVGGILALAKKVVREKELRAGEAAVSASLMEEFGDVLWYLTALSRRRQIDVGEIFREAASFFSERTYLAATGLPGAACAVVLAGSGRVDSEPWRTLFDLGGAAEGLLRGAASDTISRDHLIMFARCFLSAVYTYDLDLAAVMRSNISKVEGRFLPPNLAALENYDAKYLLEERIPTQLEIEVRIRGGGRSFLRVNDVNVGDPLTDNIADKDGYRFHDVFHFAHAAVLHWSPVLRALLKIKRKSCPKTDEEQDGGRAIVVEEGLTAWVFSQAKAQGMFEGLERLPFDLLKTVGQFVRGYEVESCPLSLWERAILQGYRVFREVRRNEGGCVLIDRSAREITYSPLRVIS